MKKKLPRISRAKFENIAYLTLNAVNMATYLMVFAASITKAKQGRLAEIIQAIYCTQSANVVYPSLGCIVMCEVAFNIIVAIVAFTMGFAYCILSLIPALPPPNSFWTHWQNHRDFWAEGLDLTVPKIHTAAAAPINNNGHLLHPCAWHPSSSKIASANSILYYQQRQQDPRLLGVYY
ncbi:hypothetical protein V8B55DRAFT_1333806 [Mucor lusitanicus]